jgi:parvulin-like peptidyl-prolyl isomerase
MYAQEQHVMEARAGTLGRELSEALEARKEAVKAHDLAQQQTAEEVAKAAETEQQLRKLQDQMAAASEDFDRKLEETRQRLQAVLDQRHQEDQERIKALEAELLAFKSSQMIAQAQAMTTEDWDQVKAKGGGSDDDDLEGVDEACNMLPGGGLRGQRWGARSVAGSDVLSQASWSSTGSKASSRSSKVKASWNMVLDKATSGNKHEAAQAFIMRALEQHFPVEKKVMDELKAQHFPVEQQKVTDELKGRMDRQALARKTKVYDAYNRVAQLMVFGKVIAAGDKPKVKDVDGKHGDDDGSAMIVLDKPGYDDISGWLMTCLKEIHQKTCRMLPAEGNPRKRSDNMRRNLLYGFGAWIPLRLLYIIL